MLSGTGLFGSNNKRRWMMKKIKYVAPKIVGSAVVHPC
jgi:hypothetical protein